MLWRCCSAPLCSVFWRGRCNSFRCQTQLGVLQRHKSVSSIPNWETSPLFRRSVGKMRERADEPRFPLFKSKEPSSSAGSVIKDFVTNFAAEESRCCARNGLPLTGVSSGSRSARRNRFQFVCILQEKQTRLGCAAIRAPGSAVLSVLPTSGGRNMTAGGKRVEEAGEQLLHPARQKRVEEAGKLLLHPGGKKKKKKTGRGEGRKTTVAPGNFLKSFFANYFWPPSTARMFGAACAPMAPNGAEPFPVAASEPQRSGCYHLAGHPAPLSASGLPLSSSCPVCPSLCTTSLSLPSPPVPCVSSTAA